MMNGGQTIRDVRFVYWGVLQIERIDFEETFTSIVSLEATRMHLACACSKGFKVYHMDRKSTFPNNNIKKYTLNHQKGLGNIFFVNWRKLCID